MDSPDKPETTTESFEDTDEVSRTTPHCSVLQVVAFSSQLSENYVHQRELVCEKPLWVVFSWRCFNLQ